MSTRSNQDNKKELSPCVRNCCLDQNDICLGCYRHISEIIGWQEKSESEKKEILACCNQRKSKSFTS
ncbi:DUF1289 domain-containing protein [Colwellia sp. E150_009]